MRTITVVLAVAFLASAGAVPVAAGQEKTARADQGPSATADKTESKPAGDATQKPVKPAPPRPEPTGLERLSSDWPKWLKVNLLYRGRMEAQRTLGASTSPSDGYYLNRLRLSASVQAGKWVLVSGQIHDTAQMGYQLTPTVPGAVSGGFDLRTGYVEVGRKTPRGATVAGGRMEYTLGDGRLIASPDWGNSSRTYDMGRVSAFLPGVKIDVFRSAPVVIDTTKFDRVKPGEHFWGQYATFDKVPRFTVIDVYAVQKMNSVVTGETGAKGEGRVYTYGGRVVAPITKSVTYDVDAAFQRGRLANDDLSAWAVHAAVAWTLSKSAVKPKLSFEYDYASGDKNAKDGAKQTFDQLYASNHAKYGMADLIGWRNMEVFEVKFEVSLHKKVKVNAAVNWLMLATVSDGWYASGGSRIVLNAKATSRSIGWEPDVFASFAVSKEMALGAGLATLRPGGYVKQSTTIDRYWYPYAMWSLKF